MAKLERWVAKLERLVAKSAGWVNKLERLAAKLERRVPKLVSRLLATADGFESSISLKYKKWTTYAKERPIHSSPPKKVHKSLIASDKVEWRLLLLVAYKEKLATCWLFFAALAYSF